MSKSEIEIVEFTAEHLIASTKDLYCVIFYGPDSDCHEHQELLAAERAIQCANFHNDFRCHRAEGGVWAEAISYERLRERYDKDEQYADVEERVEARMEKLRDDQTRPRGIVRRLAARAAAMIW